MARVVPSPRVPVRPVPHAVSFAYSFRLDQYRIENTRSLETDTNIVGYTVNIGSSTYTQSMGPNDAGDGIHDIGLEFPGLAISDPTTSVMIAYTIVNAGHDATQVEALIQKGVDELIASGAKEVEGSSNASTAQKAAAAAAAAAVTAAPSFGTSLIILGGTLAVDFGLSLLFANCDGSCVADKIGVPRSEIDALFPTSGCVVSQTVHYPGSDSSDGCGANSSYYLTHTITRAQIGHNNEPAAGALFIIAGRSSGLVLDIPGGAETQGLQIQQWPDNGSNAQHWELEPVDGSYFIIRSSRDGLVLEVKGNSTADHAAIQQNVYTGAHNQHWSIEPVTVDPPSIVLPVLQASKYYRIRSRSSNKVLDVTGAAANQGTKIQQFGAKSSNYSNQLWQFLQIPDAASTGPIAARQ
jgi:hypothetical protein